MSMSIDIAQDHILYQVQQADIDLATKLAEESYNKYSKLVIKKKSPYHQNNPKSHLVGKIGEVAAGNAFMELKQMLGWTYTIDQVYLDPARDSSCDIVINNVRIEIKTWRPSDWSKYGACVAERQAVKMAKKADVVVYGTYNNCTNEYELKGWNSMKDIMNVTPQLTGPSGKQVLNRVMTHRCITQLPLSQVDQETSLS
ncbi:hypothetical protein NVP2275O_108 [Vibrio phage 2.275.O._10N.286.54.E11]|nr:hypothetical protein NVP2275O_108 [Vibrio phage 2.275.O._10N.286.54.E11]